MRTLAKSKWFSIVESDAKQEVVACSNEVLVIAQEADGRILMVEEPSYAFGGTQLFLPGGGIEAGEDSAVAGQRELREETGLGAATVTPLGKVRAWAKYLQMTSYVVFATGLHEAPLTGDEEYTITVHRKSRAELEQLIASGEICDARVIAALSLWFGTTWPGKIATHPQSVAI